jgi:hypothetical protein
MTTRYCVDCVYGLLPAAEAPCTACLLPGLGALKPNWTPIKMANIPNADGSAVVGRKDDSGKLDMNLLDDMPRAVAALVEVMQWAITEKKPTPYERGSWQAVSADRYRAAIKRHDRAACEQATGSCVGSTILPARLQRDPETSLLHLAHQACSAMMALENVLREIE